MMNKRKNLSIIGICFVFLTGLFILQSCNMDKAAFETIQESLFTDSGHNDLTSEAFTHWDEDDPAVVPSSCAKCHSAGGFEEFTDTGAVANSHEPGSLTCETCHTDVENGTPKVFASVTFPSGITVKGELNEDGTHQPLGHEGICMNCHQGRSSGPSVMAGLAGLPLDTPSSSIRFSNIHYFPAGAILYGTLAKGGYEYAGNTYDGKFGHVTGYNSCTDCHNPHSLEIKVEQCDTCHSGIETKEDLHNIRYFGSMTDYDGDGDKSEGIYYELKGLQSALFNGMLVYSRNVVGVTIGYEAHTYPYFFTDKNDDGRIDESEAAYSNSYKNFTPRLAKAAYNYQTSQKDPGAFAHGGKYLIQLMYDSVADLNSVTGGVNMSGMTRDDEGHFAGSHEAWRHFDGDGEVRNSCARCHSATGLAKFIETGANEDPEPIANGMLCTTCHSGPPALRQLADVKFPSGDVVSLGDASNLCMACHQGRASKESVDSKISSGTGNYSFTNIHYFPTAAVLFGSEVHGGYEYSGKTYAGRQMFPNHDDRFVTCVQCHMGTMGKSPNTGHNVQKPNQADCVNCHGEDVSQPNPGSDPSKFKFSGIRPANIPDYDGDGDRTESMKYEIKGLEEVLYAQMQLRSKLIGAPLVYDSHTYPYFFKDNNGNGVVDPGEAIYPNGYKFNAKLLKAAYNYQMSKKEPHGYIHNARYVAQLLVDSIGDLGGNVAPYSWR